MTTTSTVESAVSAGDPSQKEPQDAGAFAELRRRDSRPHIDITEEDLKVLSLRVWRAIDLRNRPPRLFLHGRSPARVETDSRGVPLLVDLGVDGLAYEVARACLLEQQSESGKTTSIVHPPGWLVRDLLVDPNAPLPPLDRLVDVPVFAPDGTLQTEPGYHPRSRTFFVAPRGLVLEPVPAAPTASDVAVACEYLLDELLVDFRFASDSDRAHAVGLFLLPFVRDLIDGPTPLHAVEASTPGTGKGLLCDVLLYPSTGQHIGIITQAADDEEWRKRITARLIEGRSVVLIDNIKRALDSGVLCAALTADYWEDRILGRSENVRIPLRSVWVATGNNITYSTEMARRTVRIRLEADRDRPWEKPPESFRHPHLRDWVHENRDALIWAGLTLVSAWLAAGRPEGEHSLGSFETWSRVLGGIVTHAGIPGFLANTNEFYDISDLEGSVWRAFVAAWAAEFGTRPVRVAVLLPIAAKVDGLDLGTGDARAQAISLGKQLMGQRDRIIEGYRIVLGPKDHNAATWRLLALQGAFDAAEPAKRGM